MDDGDVFPAQISRMQYLLMHFYRYDLFRAKLHGKIDGRVVHIAPVHVFFTVDHLYRKGRICGCGRNQPVYSVIPHHVLGHKDRRAALSPCDHAAKIHR